MDDSARSRGTHREKSIAALIAAILVIAAFWVVLTYRSSDNGVTKTTESSTNTSSQVMVTNTTAVSSQVMALSASDYNSSLGLRLTLSISNSTIPQDDGLSLHISLNNTLATQNNLPPNGQGNFLPASWNLQACSNWPIGVQMFQGNYAPSNLSQASPLNILNPNGVGQGCPSLPRSEISFAPMSGNITSPVGWSVNQSSDRIEYWGFWTGNEFPPSDNAAFHSFTPGTWTIEGEDWWGQVALVHLQVVPNEHPLDCTTIASNPAFLESDNFSSSAGPLTLERYYTDLQSNMVVLALTTTGNSTLTVSNPYTGNNGFGPFTFSPNSSMTESFQYYSPNGTLGDPAMVFPGECSLVSMHLTYSQLPLSGTLNFEVGNQEQTFTFKP
jgi:hypothetical protein